MKSRKDRWTSLLEDRLEAAVMKLAAILIALGLLGLTAMLFWHLIK